MHRTQISLQSHQYEGLTREARRLGISMSELIRRLIDEHLRSRPAGSEDDPLNELVGIAEGSGEYVGRRHNRFLYGKPGD